MSPLLTPALPSLKRKILLPFFLVLGLLGATATVGTIFLITTAFSRSTDHRLASLQDVLYREIKGEENLLLTYANILEYADAAAAESSSGQRVGIMRDQMFKAMGDAQIAVAYFPADMRQELPSPSLHRLLTQAVRSGRPRFRFSADMNTVPSLMVAVPTGVNEPAPRVMVLQTPMGQPFLRRLTAGFNADAALLSLEGKVLTATQESFIPPPLTSEEMEAVLRGKLLYKENGSLWTRKVLFKAIPLGTTDMVVTVAEVFTGDLGGLVSSLTVRFALTLLAALLLGAFLYSRLISQITAPTRELLQATAAVSEGNLDYRIDRVPAGEMGRLAESFNAMTAQLKALYQENIDRERELTLAQEELKYKEVLEQKNEEVERTNRELKAHLGELSALFQLNQAMISTLDISQLFERIMEVLRDVIGCEGMALLLYHPGMEELELRKTAGLDLNLLQGTAVRLDSPLIGRAARSQELFYLPNLAVDYPKLGYVGNTSLPGSMVCAPMVVKKRLAGVLNLYKSGIHGFTEVELKLVQAVANQAAIAVENARLYEKTRNLSNTDELTGLANRRYFHEIMKREMAQARRYASRFSLIMADVDHFKLYNDTCGHLVGDLALKSIAQILLQNTRGIDLVARFGGEEFVILLPKTDRRGALAAAEKLRQCVAEAVFAQPLGNSGGGLTLSLGVAEFPVDGKEMYELLDRADRALYRAKELGRNRAVSWSEEILPSPPAPLSPPPA